MEGKRKVTKGNSDNKKTNTKKNKGVAKKANTLNYSGRQIVDCHIDSGSEHRPNHRRMASELRPEE